MALNWREHFKKIIVVIYQQEMRKISEFQSDERFVVTKISAFI